jgi:hypothetical protein
VRVAVHQSEFDGDARRLLDVDETATFEGLSSSRYFGPPERDRRQVDPVTSIGGLPVLYGSVSAEQRQVRYCLEDYDSHIECRFELLYVPSEDVDGAVGRRSVDCDFVTRQLSGSWYVRRVECPRM